MKIGVNDIFGCYANSAYHCDFYDPMEGEIGQCKYKRNGLCNIKEVKQSRIEQEMLSMQEELIEKEKIIDELESDLNEIEHVDIDDEIENAIDENCDHCKIIGVIVDNLEQEIELENIVDNFKKKYLLE